MTNEPGKTEWTAEELGTLRSTVRELMAALGFSGGQASKDADIANSTFSQFMNDKYEGDNNAVAKKLTAWIRNKQEDLRLASMAPPEPAFTTTRNAERVLTVLRASQALQDVGVVVGPAGCGKTRAAKHYRDTGSRVVIVTASPAIATASAIMQMMLAARDASVRGRSTASKLALTVEVRRVFTSGWLVVVDEAQHLNMDALEELRAIHDDTGVGVVLMGNETVLSRIEGHQRSAAYAQLYSRAGIRTKLDGSPAEDVEAVLSTMGVTQPAAVKTALRIAEKESLRVAVKAVRRALMVAAGDRTELTSDHLRLAFAQLGGALAR